MKHKDILGVLVYFFGNDEKDWRKLINHHGNKSRSLLQVKDVSQNDESIIKIINIIQDLNLTLLFVHVYPTENIMTLYIKEKVSDIDIEKIRSKI